MATDERPVPLAAGVPSDTPPWITQELIAETIRFWQPRYGKPVSSDDAIQIILYVGRLCEVLKS